MISYNDYAAPSLSATWIPGWQQPRLLILFSSIIQKIKLNNQLIGISDAGLKRTAASEINILLADDDSDDRELFQEAISEISSGIKVTAVRNGLELMQHLTSHGVPSPTLLFLDLNMPGKTGKQCLQEIRNNPKFKSLPVIMYSTSTLQKDISDTHTIGAHFYIRKPNSFRGAIALIEKVFAVDFNLISANQPLDNYVIS